MQLCLFAHNNYVHVNYAWDNRLSFSHLFLKGWDFTQEVPLKFEYFTNQLLFQKLGFFLFIN